MNWPYGNEMVGRVTFALENDKIIQAITNMNKALHSATKIYKKRE